MFWQSLVGGLSVLAHWQVWVALAALGGLRVAFQGLVGLLIGESESRGRIAAGCITLIVAGPVLELFLLGGLVLFLLPIMLGGDHAMPLNSFAIYSLPIAKACFSALVVLFIVSILPIVGEIVSNTPGLSEFIGGVVIFRFFSAAFLERHLEHAGADVADLYPGFWSCVGYFVLAMALVYACFLGFGVLGVTISRGRFHGPSGLLVLVAVFLAGVVNLLPLFMYANHVTLAFQSVATSPPASVIPADEAINRGKAATAREDWDSAITEFTEAVRLDPKHTEAYYGRGVAYEGKCNYDKAIADYDEAVRLDPNKATAFCNRGRVYGEKREWDKAIADLSEAIRLNPKYARAYFQRGCTYFGKGCPSPVFEESGTSLEDFVVAAAWGFLGLGEADFDRAIADFAETIRLKPDCAEAYYCRGMAYRAEGEEDKADADLAEARRLGYQP